MDTPAGTVHAYTAARGPSKDLGVGTKVRLIAVYPAAYSSPRWNTRGQEEYEAYDPHIVGRVGEVRMEQDGSKTVIVDNQCPKNTVRRAVIHIQNENGAPARGGAWLEEELGQDWARELDQMGREEIAVMINETARECKAEACELRRDRWERGKEDEGFGRFRQWGVKDGRKTLGEKRKAENAKDVTVERQKRRKRMQYE